MSDKGGDRRPSRETDMAHFFALARPRAAVAALFIVVPLAAVLAPSPADAGSAGSVQVHRGGPDAKVKFRTTRPGEAFLDVQVAARGVSWAERGNESAVVSLFADGHYVTDVGQPSRRPPCRCCTGERLPELGVPRGRAVWARRRPVAAREDPTGCPRVPEDADAAVGLVADRATHDAARVQDAGGCRRSPRRAGTARPGRRTGGRRRRTARHHRRGRVRVQRRRRQVVRRPTASGARRSSWTGSPPTGRNPVGR